MTDRPTNQQTDIRGDREVTLPITSYQRILHILRSLQKYISKYTFLYGILMSKFDFFLFCPILMVLHCIVVDKPRLVTCQGFHEKYFIRNSSIFFMSSHLIRLGCPSFRPSFRNSLLVVYRIFYKEIYASKIQVEKNYSEQAGP